MSVRCVVAQLHQKGVLTWLAAPQVRARGLARVWRSDGHGRFSVFVFDEAGRLLLQRRADRKYHSGGLWSNTCCSHPRAGESLLEAAHRRLREEMGLDCPLRAVFGFVYRAALDGGLVEHEFDHVVVGRFEGVPAPDEREVGAWRWERLAAIQSQLAEEPGAFTAWFKLALDGLLARGLP